jgi:hypothetical protein
MKDQTHLMSQPKGDDTWMRKTGGFARDKTLRDHIAIEAMKAMLGPFLMKELDEVDPDGWMSGVSMDAYSMADAMLRERGEK